MGQLPEVLSDEQIARIRAQDRVAREQAAVQHAGRNGAYRYGRVDLRTQQFQPHGFSGDTAVRESHDLMHRRIRSESLNNAQIRGAERDYVDLIVGCGVQVFADPFVPWKFDLENFDEAEFDEDLRYMLEADHYFDEWANDPAQCDAEGRLTWWDMQRLALRECVRVGFCMLLKVSRAEPGRLVPRCYQLIEREQLDCNKDRPAAPGQNKIVNGIEIDSSGRVVGYWILDAHPYDLNTLTTSSRLVAADRIVPVGNPDRPSETVGVTWFHSIGQNSFDQDGFLGSELQKIRKQALLALVIKRRRRHSGGIGLDDGGDATDAYGNDLVKLGSSPVAAEIGVDEEIELLETAISSNASDFMSLLDHYSAHGLGLSYYTTTGRYETTNFSSANAAKNDEQMHMTPLQNWFAQHVAIPIRREINRELIAFGRLDTVTWEQYQSEINRFDRFEAVPSGRSMIDPVAETDAAIAKLRSGQTTLKRELAARGLHWMKVLLQRARENRVMSRLGVVIDYSKGQGGQVDKSTSVAGPTTEPAK